MKQIRNWITLTAVLTATIGASADIERWNGIAAIANDSVVTMQDVEVASAQGVEVARRTSATAEAFYQKKIEAMRDALDLLVERRLILSDFKSTGVNVPDNFIDDATNEKIRREYGDRANLNKTLKANGVRIETFRQRVKEDIILDYMERKNVREANLISPAKIERYYQTNLHKYKLNDQVKLRMIVLSRTQGSSVDGVHDFAREIRGKIVEGAPFAEMAFIYSDGSQKKEGGLLGWKEQSALRKDLAEVGFQLESNQVSGVIGFARAPDESYWSYQFDNAGNVSVARHFTDRDVFIEEKKPEGGIKQADLPVLPQEFYLLKVEDKRVAHTRSIEEVRDEIERELMVEERKRLKKQWIDRLRAKSFVRYFI